MQTELGMGMNDILTNEIRLLNYISHEENLKSDISNFLHFPVLKIQSRPKQDIQLPFYEVKYSFLSGHGRPKKSSAMSMTTLVQIAGD